MAYLKLPHPSGSAISLVERQIDLLRQQNRSLENKLVELVDIARDNQRIIDHLYILSKELIEAESLSDVVNVAQSSLREQFGVDFATIHFFTGITDDTELLISDNHRIKYFSDFLSNARPLCGCLSEDQIQNLFGANTDQVVSSALVPLSHIEDLGILALGSVDTERFHSGMGVFFLEQLGLLLSSSVVRHLA